MARKPISIYKRCTIKKGQFKYYIRIWDENLGKYLPGRSASSAVMELGLDPKKFSPTSKTGAFLIGQELIKRGGKLAKKGDILFADYLADFWDWDKSEYIQGKIARGMRIGKEYVKHCAAYVKNYIRPAFPALKLSAVKPYMIEKYMIDLAKSGKLSNRSINAILETIKTPLNEAYRLGFISSNPAAALQKLGNNTKPKGIPTEDELAALLSLEIDARVRCAIMLGAVCGLRLGEIQALRLQNIKDNTLEIRGAWGKLEGLKETKTGKNRIVPLPDFIKHAMIKLANENPHGQNGFIIYGIDANAPLDCRAIERGFDMALVQLSLGKQYSTATKEEKNLALKAWKERNITFHSLRHFVNAKLRGAVPDETLRKLTGHSTEAMTNHYDHITKDDLDALAKAQSAKILTLLKASNM